MDGFKLDLCPQDEKRESQQVVLNDERLIDNGYEPIVVKGKIPPRKEWERRPNTPEAISEDRASFPRATNTGLRTGKLVGVDIDLVDHDHARVIADLARKILGDTDLERYGQKGSMLCYRNNSPIPKITVKTNTAAKVEILGVGQQFVAYGTHPDTGRDYVWSSWCRAEPLQRKLAELIEITPGQLLEFANAAAVKLEELGYGGVKISGDIGRTSEPSARPSGRPVSADMLRDMLRFLDPNCSRDEWLRCIAALRAAPLPGDEDEVDRRALAHEWSGGALHGGVEPDKYTGSEDVDRAFDTMTPGDPADPHKIHFGSLVYAAQAAGYRGPLVDLAAKLCAHMSIDVASSEVVEGEINAGSPFSQDNIALLFADRTKGRLAHIERRGWLVNEGTHWRETEVREPWAIARALTRDIVPLSGLSEAQQRALLGNSSINGIVSLATSDLRLAIPMAAFDLDPWALNTPGGVVDLRTGALRQREPTDLFRKITAATPGGNCTRWLQFLDEVTGGGAELQRYLQRLIGYSLIGEVKEHVLAFFYGTGGNGKGVFLNTITAILGSYATTAPADMLTESKSERHPTDLAMLQGSRLVTAQETEEGRAWAEAKIKSLTGGDPITARYMRQDFFTYQPQFTLLLAGNHKPRLRNVDAAMRRRLHMIPFTIKIADPDINLGEKLQEEWPGILRWAIEGCRAWQQSHLAPPSAVLDLTERYLEDQDPIGQWFGEFCIEDPAGWASSMDLLASCNAFLDYGQGASIQVLAARLDGFGCRPERQRVPGKANPQRGFRGVRLVPQLEFRAT
jgi:putative DNA primase/helicase